MCRCLSVSRSCYYSWLKGALSKTEKANQDLTIKIKKIFSESRQTYGARRIKLSLSKKGIKISRRRIRYLMKAALLFCKARRKYKATTDSNHTLPIANNVLDRNFNVGSPNTHYVGDITYVPTKEGWLYFVVVIDLFSRKVVGYSMADNMRAELVNQALLNAIWQRKPSAGLIWHSDIGSQYAS